MDKADSESLNQRRENQFAAATASANLALQSLLLLNGGAAVSIMGVLAAISANRDVERLKPVYVLAVEILKLFSVGAGLAVAGAVCGYICNYCYAEAIGANSAGWRRAAMIAQVAGLAACVISLIFFLRAAWMLDPSSIAM